MRAFFPLIFRECKGEEGEKERERNINVTEMHIPRPGAGIGHATQVRSLDQKLNLRPSCAQIKALTI